MKCNYCNNEIPNDASFCNYCGKSIEEKKTKFLGFRLFDLYTRFYLPITAVYMLIVAICCIITGLYMENLSYYFTSFSGFTILSIVAIYNWLMYKAFSKHKKYAFALFYVSTAPVLLCYLIALFSTALEPDAMSLIFSITGTILQILFIYYMVRRRNIYTYGSADFGKYDMYRISKLKESLEKHAKFISNTENAKVRVVISSDN